MAILALLMTPCTTARGPPSLGLLGSSAGLSKWVFNRVMGDTRWMSTQHSSVALRDDEPLQ